MDRDDAIPLLYAEMDADYEEEEEEEDDMDGTDDYIIPPPSKRSRTANWEAPEHIPDFLPAFPALTPLEAPPKTSSPTRETPQQPTFELPLRMETTKVPATALTATSASDYLMQVPYGQSSLAQVAEWHLPTAPRLQDGVPARVAQIETEPALVKAYHHILTHPAPTQVGQTTLPRYKVSMGLLKLIQGVPRWDVGDTLYGCVAPNGPRVGSIGPTYPMAGEEKREKFPPTLPRAVGAGERIVPLVSQQGSRLPELARSVLPVSDCCGWACEDD